MKYVMALFYLVPCLLFAQYEVHGVTQDTFDTATNFLTISIDANTVSIGNVKADAQRNAENIMLNRFQSGFDDLIGQQQMIDNRFDSYGNTNGKP